MFLDRTMTRIQVDLWCGRALPTQASQKPPKSLPKGSSMHRLVLREILGLLKWSLFVLREFFGSRIQAHQPRKQRKYKYVRIQACSCATKTPAQMDKPKHVKMKRSSPSCSKIFQIGKTSQILKCTIFQQPLQRSKT